MRLLRCFTCRTLEELPDPPRGLDPTKIEPGQDPLLDDLIERHKNNPKCQGQNGQLFSIEDKDWHDSERREEILRQMGVETTGLPGEFYEVKATFQEDALKCFNQHNRPQGYCIDWCADSKRLGRATPEGKAWQKKNPNAPTMHLCNFCLGGETEVVTRDGIKPISSLVGFAELLIPARGRDGHIGSRGKFAEVEVRAFGVQPLWEVALRRTDGSGFRKSVRTTAEHRWVLNDGSITTTATLAPGASLKPLKATPARGKEMEVPVGVAQGFTYGDGSVGHADRRPASVTFYAEKDKALLGYFASQEPKMIRVNGTTAWHISALPRAWKRLPSLDDSRSFLFSWLAGYFAADGTVDRNGSASISSASHEALLFVRDLAAVCGVGTGKIRSRQRSGFGAPETALYTLGLNAFDLPDWFWIQDHHRERVAERQSRHEKILSRGRRGWVVESAFPLGVSEEVYCAVVPDVAAFALADDLMTGNCPVATTVAVAQRHTKGLYN